MINLANLSPGCQRNAEHCDRQTRQYHAAVLDSQHNIIKSRPIEKKLIKSGLDPHNQALLVYFITCFVNGTEPHVTDDHYARVRGIFADQSTIGWKYFLQ